MVFSRDKVLQVLRVPGVFGLCTAGYWEYSQYYEIVYGNGNSLSIPGLSTVEYCCCTLCISGFCTAGTAKYWQHFFGWYCEYCGYSDYQNNLIMYSILGA